MKNTLLGKDPDAGKERRQEEKVQQRTRWLDGITDSMNVSLGELRAISSSVAPSPPAFALPQHQDLFQGVCSSHQVPKYCPARSEHGRGSRALALVCAARPGRARAAGGGCFRIETSQLLHLPELCLSVSCGVQVSSGWPQGRGSAQTHKGRSGWVSCLPTKETVLSYMWMPVNLPGGGHTKSKW